MKYAREYSSIGANQQRGMFASLFVFLFKTLLVVAAISLVSGVVLYFYLKDNQEAQERFVDTLRSLGIYDKIVDENGTINIKLPSVNDLTESLNKIGLLKDNPREVLAGVKGIEKVPDNLLPFLMSLRNNKDFPKYVESLSKDKVGDKGDGALPILARGLESSNREISKAAEESLRLINTVGSYDVLRKHRQLKYMRDKALGKDMESLKDIKIREE